MHRTIIDLQDGSVTTVNLTDEEIAALPKAQPYSAQARRASMKLSFAQLMIGLVAEKWITAAEAEAWLAGTLPFALLVVIDTLPEDQRFPVKARAIRPAEVLRSDPMVAAMGFAAGKTEADIDVFFLTYASV